VHEAGRAAGDDRTGDRDSRARRFWRQVEAIAPATPAWSRGRPESAVLVNRGADQTRPHTVDEVGDDQIPHNGVRAKADHQDRAPRRSAPPDTIRASLGPRLATNRPGDGGEHAEHRGHRNREQSGMQRAVATNVLQIQRVEGTESRLGSPTSTTRSAPRARERRAAKYRMSTSGSGWRDSRTTNTIAASKATANKATIGAEPHPLRGPSMIPEVRQPAAQSSPAARRVEPPGLLSPRPRARTAA